jgi:hypothetical protein
MASSCLKYDVLNRSDDVGIAADVPGYTPSAESLTDIGSDHAWAPVNANRANTDTGSFAIPAPSLIKCRTPGK